MLLSESQKKILTTLGISRAEFLRAVIASRDDGTFQPQPRSRKVTICSVAINEARIGRDEFPEWIKLIPAGTFGTRDGRGPFVNAQPDAVIAAAKALDLEEGLPIDVNHATDFAAPEGRPSPAAGWIKELQNRAGEIWGRIEWTDLGKEACAKGPNGEPPKYRYVSPVFQYDDDTGLVTSLMRAGLTNNPNLYGSGIW